MDYRSRIPMITKDGSFTMSIPELNITYHSVYGAITESQHVYIDAGLKASGQTGTIRLLEMGFGTGLNALLTLAEAGKLQPDIHYTAVELYPLSAEEAGSLNYCRLLQREDLETVFREMHRCAWNQEIQLAPGFILRKLMLDIREYAMPETYDLIYYDAFAPAAQPGLWSREIFEKMYSLLSPAGILVTYCSKGDVRRAMIAAGFDAERIPGPPGKREMLRARKKEKGE